MMDAVMDMKTTTTATAAVSGRERRRAHERSASDIFEFVQSSAWASGATASASLSAARGGRPPVHARSRSFAEPPSLGVVLENEPGIVGETEYEGEDEGEETKKGGKARDDDELTEEEKRLRRAQANRLSAAKSRMKKLRRLVEQEREVDEKTARVTALRAAVEELRVKHAELTARNVELQAMRQASAGIMSSVVEPVVDIDIDASIELIHSLGYVDDTFQDMSIDGDALLRSSSVERALYETTDSFFAATPPRPSRTTSNQS